MTDLLTFEQVSFGYRPGADVLRSFSLGIAAGTATVVLGPNGVGKSTLLHLALGWLTPASGRILLDGHPLLALPRRRRGRTIALVPQAERSPFEYTVLDYVMLARAPHLPPLAMPGPRDEQAAREAIEAAGLTALTDRPVPTLSGGEHQLALVARAVAQQPRLLLMDEPTAHLDLAHKARLIRLIRSLIAAGVTVLTSTHEPDIAAAIATHIVLVRGGRVLRAGPRAEVFTGIDLTATYGVPVEIARIGDREVVLWT